ncbi:MFS transporter [Guggenheimella bovis]
MENKLILMIVTLIFSIGLTIYLFRHYELNKKQFFLFLLLVAFWSTVNVIRSYRKSYALQPLDVGGLAMGAVKAANIAAAYGLISLIMRFPVFWIADWFRSRRTMFFISTLFLTITGIWVLKNPSFDSLLCSSLAMGLGASMLSVFNVAFSETFTPKQAMMSVSILSVAPLLAEFMMSPFQYFATLHKPRNYASLWVVSLVLCVVTLVMLFLFKEDRSPKRLMTKESFKRVISHRELWIFGIVGILVSFIRFGLTGSNLVTYVQSPFIDMSPLLVAYIDFIYSVTQLVAGVLAGLYFAKRFSTVKTLTLGLILSFSFNVILLLTKNPTILFITYGISGFGYGLTYNSLIGLAMEPYEREDRSMSMGIFQTFFSIGIFYGDKVYALIQKTLPEHISEELMYQRVFLVILGFTTATILLVGLLRTITKKAQN